MYIANYVHCKLPSNVKLLARQFDGLCSLQVCTLAKSVHSTPGGRTGKLRLLL